jgi:putative cofactor-binding repeat protein
MATNKHFCCHKDIAKCSLVLFPLLVLFLLSCGDNTTNPIEPKLPFKNVQDFGAIGDGKADDTMPINKALLGGGDVYFPPGTYRVSATLRVVSGTTLRGAGRGVTTIQMVTPGHGATINVRGDNVVVADLALQGPSPSEDTYTAHETGIRVGPAISTTLSRDIQIRDCSIFNYGFHGIELDSVSKANIARNDIHRIGYAGVACLSSYDVIVSENTIESITPGTQGDAYGIMFSHWTLQEPSSSRCIAYGNTILNIPGWSGLDTHNGTFITFANNVIEGCRIGIHAGGVENANVTMRNINIIGNTIVAGRASHLHSGIIVSGRANRYAEKCVVADNIVDGYGIPANQNNGNDRAGAIYVVYAGGVSVTGNVVENFAESGIIFQQDNTNFVCSGNLISSGTSLTKAYGIRVRDTNNSGYITGNRANGLPICVLNDPSNNVRVGDNDNVGTCN